LLLGPQIPKTTPRYDELMYLDGAKKELLALSESLSSSGLTSKLRIVLIYIPLAGKAELVQAFDARLKVLQ
jgi:hypothetical protein